MNKKNLKKSEDPHSTPLEVGYSPDESLFMYHSTIFRDRDNPVFQTPVLWWPEMIAQRKDRILICMLEPVDSV